MKFSLAVLAAFIVAVAVAPVAKADCRYANVQQVVVQEYAQPVVVQRVVQTYTQPVVVQRQFVQMGYGGQAFVQRSNFSGGYGSRQSFRGQAFSGRQNLDGGGGGLGQIINRQNIGVGLGAAAGAALGGPLGAAGGAVVGNILFGGGR